MIRAVYSMAVINTREYCKSTSMVRYSGIPLFVNRSITWCTCNTVRSSTSKYICMLIHTLIAFNFFFLSGRTYMCLSKTPERCVLHVYSTGYTYATP